MMMNVTTSTFVEWVWMVRRRTVPLSIFSLVSSNVLKLTEMFRRQDSRAIRHCQSGPHRRRETTVDRRIETCSQGTTAERY